MTPRAVLICAAVGGAGFAGAAAAQTQGPATLHDPQHAVREVAESVPTHTFILNAFTVNGTRAAHTDTDYVSASISVAGGSPTSMSMAGAAENGTYVLNLTVPNIAVAANQSVDFSYGIFSSGNAPDALAAAVEQTVGEAAQKTAAGGVAAARTSAGASLRSVAGSGATAWLTGKIGGVDFTGCDGPVAAGDHMFSGEQLAAQTTADGTITMTDVNSGAGAPADCGKSMYYVTWTVIADQ